MNIRPAVIAILLMLTAPVLFGQTSSVSIPTNIVLPRDTVFNHAFLTSLNSFLLQTGKPNKENSCIQNADLLETSVLLDELKDAGLNTKLKDANFYKPYLTNFIRLNDTDFLIQLSYLGINENTPVLQSSFTLLASKVGTQFYFRSPLKQNTKSWKLTKLDQTNIYFKNVLNEVQAKAYFTLIANFDKKLNAVKTPTNFYCADDFHEVLQLIGVDYKAAYNSYAHNSETAKENDCYLNVNGTLTSNFTKFDPHDLWHERLHQVLSITIINKPVDEGTAYLYGGSWGYTWLEILAKFKTYAEANPQTNWLELYNESKNFDPAGRYPLNVDYAINALLTKKIEQEKGFPAVIQLLSCGKKEKGNENYFEVLAKITGIKKVDFNDNVWKLIREN